MFLEDIVPSLVGDKRYEAWYAKLERLAASPGAAVGAGADGHADRRPRRPAHDPCPDARAPPARRSGHPDRGRAGTSPSMCPGRSSSSSRAPTTGRGSATSGPIEEIQEFLTGMRDGGEADRVLATVMFIDIVESTKRAAELGDRRWTDLLASFYAVVRRELDRFRGREIDTAGDGFFVTFDGPARAIRCAAVARRGGRGDRSRDPGRDPHRRGRAGRRTSSAGWRW